MLVEVHDERELDQALEIDADVIGINNRNLADLEVDLERTLELLADVPAGKTVVSESGYSTREQLDELDGSAWTPCWWASPCCGPRTSRRPAAR